MKQLPEGAKLHQSDSESDIYSCSLDRVGVGKYTVSCFTNISSEDAR